MEAYVNDMLIKSQATLNYIADLQKTFGTLRWFWMKLNLMKYAFGVTVDKFFGFMISRRGIEVNPEKIKTVLEMAPSKTIGKVQHLTGKIISLNRFISRSVERCLSFFKTLRQPRDFQWTTEYQKIFEELN